MVDDLNALATYLARRDMTALTPENPTDLLLVTGSCLLSPLEVAAYALKYEVTPLLLLSGGIGHSTPHLYDSVAHHPEYHTVATEGRAEADIMYDILTGHLEVEPSLILVENQSTNCGANAEESKRLLDARGIHPKKVVLIQDPTMQRRTHASCERSWQGTETEIHSFAPFIPWVYEKKPGTFVVEGEGEGEGEGVWPFERFLSLILGEIPRLRDDENGYGPEGKNYIDHVEIPEELLQAYERLAKRFPFASRPS